MQIRKKQSSNAYQSSVFLKSRLNINFHCIIYDKIAKIKFFFLKAKSDSFLLTILDHFLTNLDQLFVWTNRVVFSTHPVVKLNFSCK